MTDWDSKQYLRFAAERTQPSVDLIRRIGLQHPGRILDVGCGPGNSTAQLAGNFPGSRILGIDSSPDMIQRAGRDYPELEFRLMDITRAEFGPETFDIVFSNAAIQWIPDHPVLIPALFRLVRPGGALACQIPMNHQEPSHMHIREIAHSGRWKERLGSLRVFYNLTPPEYYDLFSSLTEDFALWTTTYYHPMTDHRDILEWLRGTGLRPFLAALSDSEREELEGQLLERYRSDYPVQRDGRVLLRFPRFFFILRKGRTAKR